MLGKCLNPKCSAQFRYLHEGRVICLTSYRTHDQHQANGHHFKVEYVWMCRACSGVFEPVREASGTIGIRPLTRALAKDVGCKHTSRCDQNMRGGELCLAAQPVRP